MTTGNDISDALLDSPEEVLDLLREQASLHARLESFAARQRSLVTGDDVGGLLKLLADRQKLSEVLSRIALRLKPVRREWSTYWERFTPFQRAEADRLLSDAGQSLRRVIESDEEDARLLSGRKQAVAGALHGTHRTGQAISAYRASTDRPGRLDCLDEGY